MLGFSIVKPPFSFTDVKTITKTDNISIAIQCLQFLRKILGPFIREKISRG